MPGTPEVLSQVLLALRRAQGLGMLGPAPIELHLSHAGGFLEVIGTPKPDNLLDLGSGAGVPGLLLAAMLPFTQVVLLDSNLRRTNFLVQTVAEVGLAGRVRVIRGRAEELARQGTWREMSDVVVARSFGRPATTAESGTGLVRQDGIMVVSDPPKPEIPLAEVASGGTGEVRWPSSPLAGLGLVPREGLVKEGFSFQVLDKVWPCPTRYPRRSGLPRSRPLF